MIDRILSLGQVDITLQLLEIYPKTLREWKQFLDEVAHSTFCQFGPWQNNKITHLLTVKHGRPVSQSSFLISLVELDEINKIKLSKIGRLDQGLNPGFLHNSQAC